MPLASGADYLYVENGPRAPVEPNTVRKLVRVSKPALPCFLRGGFNLNHADHGKDNDIDGEKITIYGYLHLLHTPLHPKFERLQVGIIFNI